MSGPKVVRIVTREEVLQICHAALARVDAAIAEFSRVAERNGLLDEATRAEVKARRDRLSQWLAADRHLDVQKQAPLLEEWLQTTLQEALEGQLSREAAARASRRNLEATAASLLARGEDLPSEVRAGLSSADTRALEGAVARAFQLLAEAGAAAAASAQRELASRLREDGAPVQSLDEWLRSQAPPAPEDPRLAAAGRQLGLLAALGGSRSEDLAARLEALRADRAAATWSLRLDALALDLRRALEEAKSLAELRKAVLAVRLEGEPASSATLEAVESALSAGQVEEARERFEDLSRLRKEQAAAKAAEARRNVVLGGLRALGYDVREGMATAWARDGRVVMRSPRRPGVGVEVGGVGERLQVRVVGLQGAAREAAADREAETEWCGEVARLQELVAAQGGALEIERALPAGAQPLKVVADEWWDDEDLDAGRTMSR